MSDDFVLVADDGVTELNYIDSGTTPPGEDFLLKVGYKNVTADKRISIENVWCPDMVGHTFNNTGGKFPLLFASIIKQDENDNWQVNSVDETDPVLGKLTAIQERNKCFRFNGATGNFTDFSTGNITFMQAVTDYVIFGVNEWTKNLYIEIDTAGNWVGFVWEYWNGIAWTSLPGDAVDGTSGLTVSGNLFLGTITQTLWQKYYQNAYRMLWVRCKAPGGIVTPAVATDAYWNYVYDTPLPFIKGVGAYSDCDEAGTAIYTPVTPAFEYPAMGRVVFDTDPLLGVGHTLRATYQAKNPPAGLYEFTFQSCSSTTQTGQVMVNAGDPIGISFTPGQYMRSVIAGMIMAFAYDLADDNLANLTISQALKYLWFAEDAGVTPTEFTNGDFTFASTIDPDEVNYFWVKYSPPVDYPTNENMIYANIYAVNTAVTI